MDSSIQRFIELNSRVDSLSTEEIKEYKTLLEEISTDPSEHYSDSDIQKETEQLEDAILREVEIPKDCSASYIMAQIDSIISKIEKGDISQEHQIIISKYFTYHAKVIKNIEWGCKGKSKDKRIGRPHISVDQL